MTNVKDTAYLAGPMVDSMLVNGKTENNTEREPISV